MSPITNRFSENALPTFLQRKRCSERLASNAVARPGSIGSFLAEEAVFGALRYVLPFEPLPIACSTFSQPCLRSTDFHWSAHISPTLIPVESASLMAVGRYPLVWSRRATNRLSSSRVSDRGLVCWRLGPLMPSVTSFWIRLFVIANRTARRHSCKVSFIVEGE